MAKILVIDDEEGILNLVQKTLEKDGHQVTAKTSPDEVNPAYFNYYDLMILDVMMPGKDGFAWCREIRDQVDCPILFLTAKTMESDAAEGFQSGGDDYIRKPFGITELRERVNAHLRREKREHHRMLSFGAVRFDLQADRVTVNGEALNLTKSEYRICLYLARHRGQVFSKSQILEMLYDYEGESSEGAIAEHIKNIRAKFKKQGETPIDTVWGIGYRWH